MSSHANCTHEKTKAARAACRAGKAQPKRLIDPDTLTHMQRLDPVTGEPIGPKIKLRERAGKDYISGHCATGNHDRCAGVYAGTSCSCTCDHTR